MSPASGKGGWSAAGDPTHRRGLRWALVRSPWRDRPHRADAELGGSTPGAGAPRTPLCAAPTMVPGQQPVRPAALQGGHPRQGNSVCEGRQGQTKLGWVASTLRTPRVIAECAAPKLGEQRRTEQRLGPGPAQRDSLPSDQMKGKPARPTDLGAAGRSTYRPGVGCAAGCPCPAVSALEKS